MLSSGGIGVFVYVHPSKGQIGAYSHSKGVSPTWGMHTLQMKQKDDVHALFLKGFYDIYIMATKRIYT